MRPFNLGFDTLRPRRSVTAAVAAGLWLGNAPVAIAQDDTATATATATAGSEEVEQAFDVVEYRVLGADVLPRADVERALYGHLGAGKTIADVERARVALESAYRNAGYSTVFVDIPEQSVDRGVVRLNVTEGKLDRLRVTGARYFANRRILARLPALQSGTVPHFPAVQSELGTLNRATPDRQVTPILRAGRFPGTVDMELRVEDDLPFHGSFELNDRYTADTSELRANLGLSYANLWQKSHTVSLQYQVAPEEPDEAEVVAATYTASLERANSILALYAVDSSSDVATVGTLSVLGQGNIFGVRGIKLLDSVDDFFHNVTLGVDLKDFDENILLDVDDGLRTAIKYVNWSASYAFGWTKARSQSELSIGAAWGLRGMGNDDAEFEEKRFRARANYGYLSGTAQHSRQVFADARFLVRMAWQYANSPLISNEQFTVGGVSSARGYLEAERLGDYGANVSVEFLSPSLLNGERADFRFLAFVDAASVAIEDPLPSQDQRYRLASAGAGVRLKLAGLALDLDWARALRDAANVDAGEERVHAAIRYTF